MPILSTWELDKFLYVVYTASVEINYEYNANELSGFVRPPKILINCISYWLQKECIKRIQIEQTILFVSIQIYDWI